MPVTPLELSLATTAIIFSIAAAPLPGMFPNSDYQKCTLSFEGGALGVLFTDGIGEVLPIEADSLPEFLRGAILRKSQDQNPQGICESY